MQNNILLMYIVEELWYKFVLYYSEVTSNVRKKKEERESTNSWTKLWFTCLEFN